MAKPDSEKRDEFYKELQESGILVTQNAMGYEEAPQNFAADIDYYASGRPMGGQPLGHLLYQG